MNKIHVLFVDDEEFTLHALERILRKELFYKHFAGSGAEALELMAETSIHIIVSDMKMPEMNGLELLKRVKKKYPDTVRMVLSAYSETSQLLSCINYGEIYRFITKPLDPEELKTSIHDAIEYYLTRLDRIDLTRSLDKKNTHLRQALAKQKEMEQKLLQLCIVDDLTGLYNRRQLTHALRQAFQESVRYHKKLSCFMLDLDHFKKVNDTHGHAFGDFVLKEFSQRIKNSLRDTDIAFRYGGEEFFILLPETTLQEAETVALRIVESCGTTPFEDAGISDIITVSVGIASFHKCNPENPEDLIAHADNMLYKAKKAGRNRVML